MDLNHTIYIDGVAHRSTPPAAVIFVDHPALPGRPCARHTLGAAAELLCSGAPVEHGGFIYSLAPTP